MQKTLPSKLRLEIRRIIGKLPATTYHSPTDQRSYPVTIYPQPSQLPCPQLVTLWPYDHQVSSPVGYPVTVYSPPSRLPCDRIPRPPSVTLWRSTPTKVGRSLCPLPWFIRSPLATPLASTTACSGAG